MITNLFAVALLSVVVAIFLLNSLYRRTNHYKNSYLFLKTFLHGVPRELSFVNLGSTYSQHAFEALESLKFTFVNLALPNQALMYDNIILRKYSSCINKNAVVAIVVAPCLMLFEYPNKVQQRKYYAFLKRDEIRNFSMAEWVRERLPVVFAGKQVARIFGFDVPLQSDIYSGLPEYLTDEQVERNAKSIIKVWSDLFSLPDLKQTNFTDEQLKVMDGTKKELASILSFCKEKCFRPVIVIPPFSAELNLYFSDDFLNIVLKQRISEVNKEIVPVFDYQKDEKFQNDKTLFSEGNFLLSKKGSKQFIEHFFADLEELGYDI